MLIKFLRSCNVVLKVIPGPQDHFYGCPQWEDLTVAPNDTYDEDELYFENLELGKDFEYVEEK